MRKILLPALGLAFAGLRLAQAGSDPLSVSNGVLMKDGAPYRAIGFNYHDAFARYLHNGDTSYRAGFQQLSAAGVPFIRFQVLPFWPNEARPFIKNSKALFTALDQFVADAASYHIGLVPSVFWNWATVPDVEGEPVGAWGNPTSKTRLFAAQFAQQLAVHYASSPTIWMWEMSNEINDWADFPTGYKAWGIDTSQGTPASRSMADNQTSAQLLSAYRGFAAAVRAGDATRLVESGYDIPRNNAAHLAKNGSFDRDSEAQFDSVIASQNQPGDVVSVHIYPDQFYPYQPDIQRFGDRLATAEQCLPVILAACRACGKPLYIGEFGTPDSGAMPYSTASLSFLEFQNLTHTIVSVLSSSPTASGLASPWVYDFSYQSGHDGNFNITSTNERANRLKLIAQADQLLAAHP